MNFIKRIISETIFRALKGRLVGLVSLGEFSVIPLMVKLRKVKWHTAILILEYKSTYSSDAFQSDFRSLVIMLTNQFVVP